MALYPGALATVAELKRYTTLTGSGKDLELEEALGRASEDIEGEGLGGRRGVYRGPVESFTSIAAAQSIKSLVEQSSPNEGVVAIAGSPSSAGRTLVIRKTDVDRSLTAGVLTVTQASPALEESFNLADGNVLHGVKFFTAAVTARLSGCVGHQAQDTIEIGTSAGYTEFYSPCGGPAIVPREWPLRYVAAVHEDSLGLFGTGTQLVEGTDFEMRSVGSIARHIARLSSGLDSSWAAGRRTVRGRLSAGWVGPAGVPARVKGVCLELAAWHFQHAERKEFGLQTRTVDAGTITRSGPPMLTDGMLKRLAPEWRSENMPTCELGWTESAA